LISSRYGIKVGACVSQLLAAEMSWMSSAVGERSSFLSGLAAWRFEWQAHACDDSIASSGFWLLSPWLVFNLCSQLR